MPLRDLVLTLNHQKDPLPELILIISQPLDTQTLLGYRIVDIVWAPEYGGTDKWPMVVLGSDNGSIDVG